MKKCTVGIDAHKESNVMGLAFKDMKPAIVHGKVSADLNRTVDAIRKIQKKHGLEKQEPGSGLHIEHLVFPAPLSHSTRWVCSLTF